MVTDTELKSALQRLDEVERELLSLRARLLGKRQIESKPLEGLLEGMDFSESEINEAKTSWLKQDNE